MRTQATETRPPDTIAVKDVVARTGLSARTVGRMCERGELRAVRVGRRWLIARASVDELLAPALG